MNAWVKGVGCKIEDCEDSRHFARGYCQTHYRRWYNRTHKKSINKTKQVYASVKLEQEKDRANVKKKPTRPTPEQYNDAKYDLCTLLGPTTYPCHNCGWPRVKDRICDKCS